MKKSNKRLSLIHEVLPVLPFMTTSEVIFEEKLRLIFVCCKDPMKFVAIYVEMVERIIDSIKNDTQIKKDVFECCKSLRQFEHPVAKTTLAVFEQVFKNLQNKSFNLAKTPAFIEMKYELLLYCEIILSRHQKR